MMTVFAFFAGTLVGVAIGFKIHEVITRPVMDEFDRLTRAEALRALRGSPR